MENNFEKSIQELGCGDGFCRIAGTRSGQHTNGRCHCLDNIQDMNLKRKISDAFSLYREQILNLNRASQGIRY